jgi:hypothetical protein
MNFRNVLLTSLAAAVWPGGMAWAQEGPGGGLTPIDARFVEAPGLGVQIPDITIVDDQGNPANIRELARRKPYTVLTLGCLT